MNDYSHRRSKKNHLIFFLVIIFCSLLTTSCNKNKIYEKYEKIDHYVWSSDSIITFSVEIDDTASLYNLDLLIRHANFYPYSNLWLTANIIRPNFSYAIDTIECILAEDNGKWLGDGLGDIWDYTKYWKQQNSTIFKQKGKYIFQINQLMRTEKLSGIMEIGLKIEKFQYQN
ncbi:MAG: gliding motility lipoprotein GldH [Bacteroidales bacterium]|jgi:gliding motility-associated lipoprotein GldH|nr:gliding motility lipoprotein GldH [Bacteroidales bacterium]